MTGQFTKSTTVPELMHRGFSVTDSDGNPQTADRQLLRNSGLTPDGLLNVTKTINEDEEVTLVFSDVHGEEVLTRRVLTDDVTGEVTYADTHTVRDALGRIAAVIPPKLTAQLEGSGASGWNYSATEDLAFLYRYDGRGNCIEKNIPGGGWTYMAYDKGGRCIFTQDAVQREEGRWAFRLVDILGRECVTGTVVRSMDVSADPIASRNIYVTRPSGSNDSGGGIEHAGDIGVDEILPDTGSLLLRGYTLNGLSSLGTGVRVLTVSYYDDYGFPGTDGTMAYAAPGIGEPYGTRSVLPTTGLLTGHLARVLDGTTNEDFLTDVFYYDDKGQMIQRCSTTVFGKTDREFVVYDFVGNVTGRKIIHAKPGTGSAVCTEIITQHYDAMGRPTRTFHALDGAAARCVSKRQHDGIGRLAALHREDVTTAGILSQSYSYNIRSWMTGISGSLFAESLAYETGTSPRWGGKISSLQWRNPSESGMRGYDFRYDGLSRLAQADYVEPSHDGDYSEQYWYDLGCNMTRRSRSGSGATALTVHDYDGNRLSSGLGSLASYDARGRLTGASSGKVRSIRYNEIGLPQEMGLSDGMKHSFSDCSTMREGGVLHNDSIIDGYWIGMHYNNIAFTIE